MSVGAGTYAGPHGFHWKTRLPTAFNAVEGSALCHSRARGGFCQVALLVACYQGAQSSRWQKPTPRMSIYYASWTRRLGFAHYDAYTVVSTDYAASYIAPTGASPTETPLGQRGYRAMKHIREEILNRCSSIEAFCAVYYTSTLDPPVGV